MTIVMMQSGPFWYGVCYVAGEKIGNGAPSRDPQKALANAIAFLEQTQDKRINGAAIL